ncbi:MAG: phosphomethylpyrimidine synthase ThiC [Candidatus Gygaella obscura]|nr:phosphomethylpyrimidine synthase ThiC [Candidatus Gygaella obscura]
MTQLEYARTGKITSLMREIAKKESIKAKLLQASIAAGKSVILKNKTHIIENPCGVGSCLSTKINANIGASKDKSSITYELKKLKTAIEYGADTIMDLTITENAKTTLKRILANCPVPLGTVPVYEAAVEAARRKGSFLRMDRDLILEVLRSQANLGVDFFTIHAGVTKFSLKKLNQSKRLMDIVSRGGAILANWIFANKKENPFYEFFDDVLEIARKYDITLSLGDGLRPGSIFDATDAAQIAELKILGQLAKKAQDKGVQVIIEGPGHVPIDQVVDNVKLEKKICNGAPFYVLGPLVTDIAAGYDHINGAIGGCLAASVGADFLCYVTPSEHLRHPDIEDVKQGVIASKIAAHAADIVKRKNKASLLDKKISIARRNRDWETQIKLSVDPKKAAKYRKSSLPKNKNVCTMCSDFCSIRLMDKAKKLCLRD